MKSIAFGAIGLGIALLLLSGLWSTLFPATSNWTPEKEQRWQKVKARMHTLSFVVADPARANLPRGTDAGTAKTEYESLQKENEHLRSEFESAADRPKTVTKILKWTGVSLAAVGLIGWYAVKNS